MDAMDRKPKPNYRMRTVTALAIAACLALTGAVADIRHGDQGVPDAILGHGAPPAGERVQYFAGDPDSLGYLAQPTGEGPFGAVILIHEWDGLVDRVMQVADALAAEGYVALAADLYSGRTGGEPAENMALVRETLAEPERIISNLDAAVTYLRNRDDVTGKVATIGWCYGGGVALSYAIGSAAHDGTAIFYGRLLDDPEQMRHIGHEIHGTFAGNDQSPPPEQVDRFVAALRTAGVRNDVHIYDDVEHGFWLYVERDLESNLGPAQDAWERLRAYLARTLR